MTSLLNYIKTSSMKMLDAIEDVNRIETNKQQQREAEAEESKQKQSEENPITDIKETAATTITTSNLNNHTNNITNNQQNNTAAVTTTLKTKIPHPLVVKKRISQQQPQQLQQQQQQKQLQRSNSLRLRGTKSNLPQFEMEQQQQQQPYANHNNTHNNDITTNTTSTTAALKDKKQNSIKTEKFNEISLNTGQQEFSLRRKFGPHPTIKSNLDIFRRPTTTTQLRPNSSGCSSSGSNSNNNLLLGQYKTDITKELATSSSSTICNIATAVVGNANSNENVAIIEDLIKNMELKEDKQQQEEKDEKILNGCEKMNGDKDDDEKNKTSDAVDGDFIIKRRNAKDNNILENKMSLKYNNSPTKTTTAVKELSSSSLSTTSVPIPVTATVPAPAPTPAIRPVTLSTKLNESGKNIGNIGIGINTKIVTTPKTPKTPKTPNTPGGGSTTVLFCNHNQSHPHQHQNSILSKSCGDRQLSVVPETKLTPKTPPVTPDSPQYYYDDDLDSLYSYATTTSGRSTMSCEHPYVARNGTTFSGRKMKYVVHCSNYAGQVGADYLTPTQRAQRQIRRLKELLGVARQDLEQKDSEILRLTREVVELRLFKASLSSPEERSASSDAVTVREAELKTSQDVSPIIDMVDDAAKSSPRHILNAQASHHHQQQQQQQNEMQSSFADSGHFEDMSVHSKDSYTAPATQDMASGNDVAETTEDVGACGGIGGGGDNAENYELQRQELIRMYEMRIEDLIRNQDAATTEVKRTHNEKVEALLQKLAECNSRYADIVPDYEHAKERIRELEKQLEDLQRKLIEHEEKQNKMYLHMYQKGQEAERIARTDQALELAHRAPNKVSINELLQQLQSTQDELENIRAAECRNECGNNHALLTAKEAISLWVLGARKTIYRRLLDAQKTRTHVDPEVTLQFLKSAIYYFLTDKENSQGHLQAIESILEFTEAEKQNINKYQHTPK